MNFFTGFNVLKNTDLKQYHSNPAVTVLTKERIIAGTRKLSFTLKGL